jgi:hypothetical protein
MPDDHVDRVRLWEDAPMKLIFGEVVEGASELIPQGLVHFADNS